MRTPYTYRLTGAAWTFFRGMTISNQPLRTAQKSISTPLLSKYPHFLDIEHIKVESFLIKVGSIFINWHLIKGRGWATGLNQAIIKILITNSCIGIQ